MIPETPKPPESGFERFPNPTATRPEKRPGNPAPAALSGVLVLVLAAAPALSSPPARDMPWYEAIARPGANFHSIVAAHEARELAKRSEQERDLTALLGRDLARMEEEDDVQFERWRNHVGPRVYPSGDLALLDKAQQAIASVVLARSDEPPRGAWEPLGPFSGGTHGAGRINWMEFHPQADSAFMVGSSSGGVWSTRDGGRSWATTTDHLAVLGSVSAVYHPANPDILYLGTGDPFGGTSASIGVLKSKDGGKTWNPTGLNYPASRDRMITKLLADPDQPEKLLVAASDGVHVSIDGGATFVKSQGIAEHVWDLERHPTDARIVYASAKSFYRSVDGGLTFTVVPGVNAGLRMLIAVSPAEPDWVYVLRGSPQSTQGVDLSTNKGASFTAKGAAAEVGCSQAFYDYSFAANPRNAQDLAAGCVDIFRSANGGSTWTLAPKDEVKVSYHSDIHNLYFRKDGTLFAATDGGLYRADGPASWTNLNGNLNIGQLYQVGADPKDYDRVCACRQDNGVDLREGGEFRKAFGGDGFVCLCNRAVTRF
jgi:photosystem II stability/assembly factor-like uncharacterized protein